MALNWKRVALLIAFIAAVLIIGFLLYYFFLRPAITMIAPTNANVNANVPPGGLPPTNANANIPVAGQVNGALPGGANVNLAPPAAPLANQIASPLAGGGLTKTTALTTVTAMQPTLASDGANAIYYDRTTGLFYRITPDGRKTPLSDEVFYNVSNITWAPDKTRAVLEYPDGAKIVYDFSKNRQVTLPKHWQDFSFSPQSDQLVFKSMGTSETSRWLAVAKADGSGAEKIEALGNQDATVYPTWSPSGQIVAMYTEGINDEQQNLYFVGTNQENFKSTIIDGRGFEGQWSTKGDRLLYSVYSSASDYKPTLYIVEASGNNIGQNRRNLKLETWSDKCTFADNDTIYCAVPTSLTKTAGIFKNELDNAPTDIYKIDLTTGFKSKVATPEISQNITNLIVTSDKRYIYYTNKNDGLLYKITLK